MRITFLILHFVCFLDYGFIKYKSYKLKLTIKLLSFLFYVCLSLVCMYCFYLSESLWFSSFWIRYTLFILILFCSSSRRSFYKLQKDLLLIDVAMGVDSSSTNIEIVILLSIIGSVGYSIIIHLVYMFFTKVESSTSVLIMYMIYSIIIDFPVLVSFFSFYSVYYRLRNLSAMVLKSSGRIVYHQRMYRSLINSIENVKPFAIDGVVSNFYNYTT